MIIKEIKLKKRLFFDDEVEVITNQKKSSFPAEWSKDLINRLNESLKNFNINSANDFANLKEKLKYLDEEKYLILEKTILKCIQNTWKFFNPGTRQVPRPMNIVLNKKKGIKEFVVFSLNAKNFDTALEANKHVIDFMTKNTKNFDELKEEDILILIKEAIDKEHELVNFELRIGAVLNNYEDEKYVYLDKSLNEEEQYKFVSKLIEKYSVVYVENPFAENSLNLYKKLSDKYRKICLVCMNSKINEYTQGINNKAFNTVVVKFNNIISLKADVDYFKDKELNIVINGEEEIMDVAVGLGTPLVKLSDNKEGYGATKKLNNISAEIVNTRLSESKTKAI